MMKGDSVITLNRTCESVVRGILLVSMVASKYGNSVFASDCIRVVDETVVQSPSICKTYASEQCISCSISGYNLYENMSSGMENVIIDEEKIYNLKKLDQIAALENGWNGNDAKAFDERLIMKVRSIITGLRIQPELFPTACDSIQVEYEKEDGAYLEIELSSEDMWEVFEINHEGRERYYSISAEIGSVNKVVNDFYGLYI